MRNILFIFLFLLFSCGSRKVEIVKKEVETKIESNEKITTIDTSNTKIRFNYEFNTFTIEAKDNLKPFTYNTHTYSNVVIRHSNVKDNTIYTKDVKTVKTKDKSVLTNVKENVKTKIVDKKESFFKYYIIIIILILGYLFFKFKRFFLI